MALGIVRTPWKSVVFIQGGSALRAGVELAMRMRSRIARDHDEDPDCRCGRLVRLLVVALAGWSLITLPAAAQTPANIVERGYNPLRTGANIAETSLAPANVRSGANQFHVAS